jgi:hypothetical protein
MTRDKNYPTMRPLTPFILLGSLIIFCCHHVIVVHSLTPQQPPSRRAFLQVASAAVPVALLVSQPQATQAAPATATSTADLSELVQKVEQAKKQLLDAVPKLIESEKWDSVRAVLIEPPLSDCWSKANRGLLVKYAEALGDKGGDELAALEAKEELVSHLRYLDMSVYNNVFNPIKVEGKSGASKELISSYYEDPKNEYQASLTALNELLSLAKDL